jgi:hypothetical protein
MRYIVTVSSRCISTFSIEAPDEETAQDLVLNGEYDMVIDVEHDDNEIRNCQIDDGKVRL